MTHAPLPPSPAPSGPFAADLHAAPFPSRRSAVMGRGGMVATSQPLAAMAGVRTLLAGGNAFDAAIAAAAALAVVEPTGCGMGGDAFALLFDAATGRVDAYDGSGAAPRAANAEALLAAGHAAVPARSAFSVTVPGAVDAWAAVAAARGTMPLAELLAPAIALAEDGYPVSERIAAAWHASEALLARHVAAREHFLPGGRAPRSGEVVRLAALGRSLRAVADGGRDAMYRGAIADEIARTVRDAGGWLTTDDLARHAGRWVAPIDVAYGPVRVFECPPPGQGLAALIALGIADGLRGEGGYGGDGVAGGGVAGDGGAGATSAEVGGGSGGAGTTGDGPSWGSIDHLHPLIEAMRLGFADAEAHVADPDGYAAPLERLLSDEHLAAQRARIRPDRAMAEATRGIPGPGGTVYLAVVDGQGNACSFIQSNYMGFGSGLVAGGTGIPLQNRGAGFTLAAGHPNRLTPLRRPFHTIMPGLATRVADGSLYAAFGVMGGHMQPQGHLQVIVDMVDFGLDPQRALDAPRFQLTPGGAIALEPWFGDDVRRALADRGHTVVPRDATPSAAAFGGGQVIALTDEGVRVGGSDPRKDGCAIAL
ncbi:MAG: gamma-glutamyltransferase family protein [Ardenticatenales bacterium]